MPVSAEKIWAYRNAIPYPRKSALAIATDLVKKHLSQVKPTLHMTLCLLKSYNKDILS